MARFLSESASRPSWAAAFCLVMVAANPVMANPVTFARSFQRDPAPRERTISTSSVYPLDPGSLELTLIGAGLCGVAFVLRRRWPRATPNGGIDSPPRRSASLYAAGKDQLPRRTRDELAAR